jgi:hypothetical protein
MDKWEGLRPLEVWGWRQLEFGLRNAELKSNSEGNRVGSNLKFGPSTEKLKIPAASLIQILKVVENYQRQLRER